MATLDIFRGSPFRMVSLTEAINEVPHRPSILGDLPIFMSENPRTKTVGIEKRSETLNLIPTSPRGAPLDKRVTETRDMRFFVAPRIAKGDRVTADELAEIRAFGSETELQQVQDEVMRRMAGPGGLMAEAELTWENMRLGAVQGIVTDADGSELFNWFSKFDISQPAEIDFDLDAATPGGGAVRKLCNQVVRGMQRAAQGAWIPGQTYVMAICGDSFWDAITGHGEIRETYLHTQQAADLREGIAWETFRYGGITWTNYRGTDDGSTVAVSADKVKFFPVNAPGVFRVMWTPGETFEAINRPGMPLYAMNVPDRDRDMFVDLEIYSYPLFVCTRPGMLWRGKRT